MKTNKSAFFTIISALLVVAMMASCGKNTEFQVDASVDGIGTQNLKALWHNAPDSVLSVAEITAVGNSFSFSGHTSEPTLVEIYSLQGVPLMQFMVDSGDKIRLRGQAADLRISGSEVGTHFAEMLARVNEEADRNAAVASLVKAHPGDRAAGALLLTAFNPKGCEAEADSLLSLLDSVAAPAWLVGDMAASVRYALGAADTVPSFRAFTQANDTFAEVPSGHHIYVLTENEMQRTAALVDSMRAWSKRKGGAEVIDLYLGCERSTWLTAIQPDSADWTQLIMPGGVAAPAFKGLNITHTPLIIETDSAGAVISRTIP